MNDLRDKKVAGFMLIELVMTLIVAAILLTIGISSCWEYIANQRAMTAAQDLVVDLLYARSEAVKRNASVFLLISRDDNNNLQGWAVTSDTGKNYSDCTANPTPSDCIAVKAAQGGIKLSDGVTSITFQSSDRLSTSLATLFNVRVAGANQRQVRIDSTGSPVITKTSVVCS